MINKEEGILLGRPPFGKSIYEYIVIPKKDDVDALEASLPKQILFQMYTINTSGVASFLKGLYKVLYRRQQVPSSTGGWLYRAILDGNSNYEPIPVDLDDPVSSLKQVDPDVRYFNYEEPPEIGSKFLLMLSRSTGAAVNMPKRFLATPIALVVKDNGERIPVLINLAEGYLYIQENPSLLRGVAILPTYKIAILIGSEIDKDEFKHEIVERISDSINAFKSDYEQAGIAVREVPGEEEEE